MTAPASPAMRELIEAFVDARIDMPELFARAGQLLPPGADASEEILELLAEAELKLRLLAGRQAFLRRLSQFAAGETSYAELDLWCLSLAQTESLSPQAGPSADPEVTLLRSVLDWIDRWQEEASRPAPGELHEFVRILAQEADPLQCLERLEETLAGFGRN